MKTSSSLGKMKPTLILLTLPFAIFITSCEGYRCGSGVVLDKTTNKPMDSVYCEVLTGVQTMYTDSTGKFDLCNRMSGCVPDCLDITIRFSKNGYKSFSINNPGDDSIIYMER